MISKKATKFDEIFTVDLTLTTYCQIDGEDFVNFCGLLRKHELYHVNVKTIEQSAQIFVAFSEMLNFTKVWEI